ncbi:unnamed protein product [Sphenostylis stenocarpa]|uniref:START domain-containing protein n=1 Tax=Sphenostylis stenocarpa TaxID=92480 RepID=A0AA86T7X1_9FABA|nr:unnamed protein product [Sphenostylis stenocarpa]
MGLKGTTEMHLMHINGNVFVPCLVLKKDQGIRIFEDVSDHKNGKGVLVKSVGVIDASVDSVFEVFLNTERQKRYEWDMLMGDLELVENYDGHYDVVYGTYDPKYLTRWHSKRDFIFSRQWFRGQDGTYSLMPNYGSQRDITLRYTLHPGIDGRTASSAQNLRRASHMRYCAKWQEYIGANPTLLQQYGTTVSHSHVSSASMSSSDFAEAEMQDEFYDAIAAESSSSDDVSDDDKGHDQEQKIQLKNVSWGMTNLALKRTPAPDLSKELDPDANSITIGVSDMHGTLRKGEDEKDTDCWTCPGGEGFMIRGKNYLKDNSKVVGGDPLLKLIAVDWLKVDKTADRIALHRRNLVQSEAGKNLPFVLVFNLQVPAKPNYSLVLYYASDRPVNKDSLLAKFLDGDDSFRDSRFKLIPSIVEGYWMVKRAVGTKACLLGKAVTCKYFKQDNFFESLLCGISWSLWVNMNNLYTYGSPVANPLSVRQLTLIDVDIGSSSVARSVIGLVLGYVTSLVVDLAILIEAKEEAELPEYLLGTVRLNRLKPESAVPLEKKRTYVGEKPVSSIRARETHLYAGIAVYAVVSDGVFDIKEKQPYSWWKARFVKSETRKINECLNFID